MDKLLARIEKYLTYTVIFLLPITALAISPNPYVVSKLAVLAFGVALILLVRSLRVISAGKLEFSVGNFDFPVALIAVAYVASALLRTPNKMEAFLLPGTATAVAGGAFLYFLINQFKEKEKSAIGKVLFASGTVFSVLILFAFSTLFSKIPQLPAYIRSQGFTPEGGYLPAAIFLGALLPLGIGILLSEKDKRKKALLGIATAITVFGLAISIYNLIPGRPFAPRFPSYSNGWFIAVDSLKESPVFGIGPGNYISAFNRYRPLSYNAGDIWAVKFATSRSYYLTALTEAGMLGVAGLILLGLTLYRIAKRDIKEKKLVHWGFAASANLVSLMLLIALLAFFPATALLLVMLFVFLSLNAKTKQTQLNLTTQAPAPLADAAGLAGKIPTQQMASRFPALLISVPVIIAIVLFGIRAQNILRAEYKFKKSLDALVQNQATETYDTMREAIQLNPLVDRYHSTFSRINLILANAIAQRAADPNVEITDADRVSITQLIQQAISEGKATVALNPLRAGNWATLARTYQAIIPFATGADAFAVQTFRQAVALDPINPGLRIALGGVYYGAGDYDNAINIFQVVTTTVKPDLANAHYNLAFAYREKGSLDLAVNAMTTALSLVNRDSNDYEVARQALEDIQEQRKAAAPTGDQLTPPAEQPEPVITPPIELPEDAEPPEAPLSPTPTPTEAEEEGEETTGTPSVSPTVTVTLTPTP